MKQIFGIIAIILAIIAYIPYFKDIAKGKTNPHVYTWFVWGFITCIIFALQIKGGGGTGAYVTLLTGIFSFVVFLLGLRYGDKDITFTDTVFFISALLATILWLFAKQPVLSVILLVVIDLLGFVPTVRKSWNKPFSETLFTWELNAFRHGLSIFALLQYNILTLVYPVAWTSACVLFSSMLIARRKIMNAKEASVSA